MTAEPGIELDLRYYPILKRSGQHESEFRRSTFRVTIPPQQLALVMVDVWDDIFIASHGERSQNIARERIKPVVEACRKLGVLVVHGPAPDVAKKYPEWRPKVDINKPTSPADESPWPPEDFRKKRGDYAKWASPNVEPDAQFTAISDNRKILPGLEPEGDDVVIADGAELHALLKQRGILWLCYAGFAANICMLNRDYAMRAMKLRGYEIILMRDGTTAMEVADTIDTLSLTEHIVINVERTTGYSIESSELLAAIEKIGADG